MASADFLDDVKVYNIIYYPICHFYRSLQIEVKYLKASYAVTWQHDAVHQVFGGPPSSDKCRLIRSRRHGSWWFWSLHCSALTWKQTGLLPMGPSQLLTSCSGGHRHSARNQDPSFSQESCAPGPVGFKPLNKSNAISWVLGTDFFWNVTDKRKEEN